MVGNGVVANMDCIGEQAGIGTGTGVEANLTGIVKKQYNNQPVTRNGGLERGPPLSPPQWPPMGGAEVVLTGSWKGQ